MNGTPTFWVPGGHTRDAVEASFRRPVTAAVLTLEPPEDAAEIDTFSAPAAAANCVPRRFSGIAMSA